MYQTWLMVGSCVISGVVAYLVAHYMINKEWKRITYQDKKR